MPFCAMYPTDVQMGSNIFVLLVFSFFHWLYYFVFCFLFLFFFFVFVCFLSLAFYGGQNLSLCVGLGSHSLITLHSRRRKHGKGPVIDNRADKYPEMLV